MAQPIGGNALMLRTHLPYAYAFLAGTCLAVMTSVLIQVPELMNPFNVRMLLICAAIVASTLTACRWISAQFRDLRAEIRHASIADQAEDMLRGPHGMG